MNEDYISTIKQRVITNVKSNKRNYTVSFNKTGFKITRTVSFKLKGKKMKTKFQTSWSWHSVIPDIEKRIDVYMEKLNVEEYK